MSVKEALPGIGMVARKILWRKFHEDLHKPRQDLILSAPYRVSTDVDVGSDLGYAPISATIPGVEELDTWASF